MRLSEVRNVLTLEEIGNLAADGGQPAETLMNVVALIAKRFRSDVCSAYLLEPDRANLVLAATVGLRKECIGSLRMEVQEGLTGLVAELVRPVAVEQVKQHPRFKYFPAAGEDAYQSFLGVPLIDRGVLQGVLVVQTIEARVFSEHEIQMLTEAATQVAPVVSEARTLDRFIAPLQERLWALGAQFVVELGSQFRQPVSRSRPGSLERSESQSSGPAKRNSSRQTGEPGCGAHAA